MAFFKRARRRVYNTKLGVRPQLPWPQACCRAPVFGRAHSGEKNPGLCCELAGCWTPERLAADRQPTGQASQLAKQANRPSKPIGQASRNRPSKPIGQARSAKQDRPSKIGQASQSAKQGTAPRHPPRITGPLLLGEWQVAIAQIPAQLPSTTVSSQTQLPGADVLEGGVHVADASRTPAPADLQLSTRTARPKALVHWLCF